MNTTNNFEANDLYPLIRQRIKELGSQGITYKKLSELSGVEERWIVRYMQGTIPEPRLSIVWDICNAIGIKLKYTVGKVPKIKK